MNIQDRIDPAAWLGHARRNRMQSIILLMVMGFFLALLGWLLWGAAGILMLMTGGVIGVLITPAISPRLIIKSYGATPIRLAQAPVLWRILSQLARRAELPAVPTLYYVPSGMLNAFTVGHRQQAVIVVTAGLLRSLDLRELAGVLAHEVSHVDHGDLWVMGLADMFSRMTSLLSLSGQFLLLVNLPLLLFTEVTINWFAVLLLVFAPTLSTLAQLALSRTREFDADLGAAWLTGDPDGLASALAKMERIQGGWRERIFMPGRRIPTPSLLRTHPETAERIARLQALKPHLGRDDTLGLHGLDDSEGHPLEPAGMPRPRRHLNGLWY